MTGPAKKLEPAPPGVGRQSAARVKVLGLEATLLFDNGPAVLVLDDGERHEVKLAQGPHFNERFDVSVKVRGAWPALDGSLPFYPAHDGERMRFELERLSETSEAHLRVWSPTMGSGWIVRKMPEGFFDPRFENDEGKILWRAAASSVSNGPPCSVRDPRAQQMPDEFDHWITFELRSGELWTFRRGEEPAPEHREVPTWPPRKPRKACR